MFGNRFSSSITCSRWRHEPKPGRLDQSRSCRFLKVATHPCVLFDDTIRNRWSGTFTLDACRLTAPTLEIALLSDTHVPDTSDNCTLGIAVAAVEPHGEKDAALTFQ